MDRRKRQKPKFISESAADVVYRIRAIRDDASMTVTQKVQALNRIQKDLQRSYGFYDRRYRELALFIENTQKELQKKEPESLTGVLNHDDTGGTACYADP